MPEGPRDPGSRTARGRRNPALLAAQAEADRLAAEQAAADAAAEGEGMQEFDMDPGGLLRQAGELDPEELPVLLPGDIIMARASISMEVEDSEAWFSYGAQTRVQPGEDEENAFWRLGAVVNTRVMDLAKAAEAEIRLEKQRQEQEARTRPIRPRRN